MVSKIKKNKERKKKERKKEISLSGSTTEIRALFADLIQLIGGKGFWAWLCSCSNGNRELNDK